MGGKEELLVFIHLCTVLFYFLQKARYISIYLLLCNKAPQTKPYIKQTFSLFLILCICLVAFLIWTGLAGLAPSVGASYMCLVLDLE